MTNPIRAAAFAALLSLAACAAQPDETQSAAAPDASRDCFNINAVSGFNDVDRDTLRVSVGAGREYELDFRGPGCNQLEWSENIAIESRPSEWICAGSGPGLGQIHFNEPTSGHARTCFIERVRRLPAPPAGS